MSPRREELVQLRDKVIRGDPPYEIDKVMETIRRSKGSPGLDELRKIGDFAPGIATLRLVLENQLAIIELLLERAR